MPIEFAPPQANLQGFNIPGPQYTDPLETLARMQQMRTQGLQQQQAQLGLQQAQQQMSSNRAMMNAFVQGAGDTKKTRDLMVQSGQVLPDQLIAFDNHVLQRDTNQATLTEKQQTIRKNFADAVAGAYKGGIGDQGALNAANTDLRSQGVPDNMLMTAFPAATPDHSSQDQIEAYANSHLMDTQRQEKELKAEQIKRERAGTAAEEAKTRETGLTIGKATKEALASDIQMAEKDPGDPTGTLPSPRGWQGIRRDPKYKDLNLPETPTSQYIAQVMGATVPPKDLPDYQLKQLKLKLGMFGDSPEEQYLARYAQSIGKTSIADLNYPEYRVGMQKYAEDKQDPQMRQIAMAQKNLQETLTQAQVASLPNPQSIDMFANMMLNHDMSPSQFAELRSGRVSWAPQVFTRAQQIAQSQGKAFSPSTLEAEYGAMGKTETAFTTGTEAQMARSFSNLMAHVGMIEEARKRLAEKDLPALQAIGNWMGAKTGGSAQTQYDLISDYVGNEAVKAFVGTAGTGEDRAKNASHFERNLGDKQIKDNITTLLQLADAQREGLEAQYKRGTYGKGSQELFTPEALATRDRFLGPRRPATQPGARPAGGAPTAPPLPARLSQGDVGKVYISPKTGKPMKITAVNPQDPTQFKSQDIP